MNVSIFGLGYVGTVSLGCLAKTGNKVIGVDINKKKVDMINNGKSTILEPSLNELIKNGVNKRLIKATHDYKHAIQNSDISIVCIGTPGKKDGSLNLNSLFNVLKQIAEGIKSKEKYHTIVIRSTILPGAYEKIVNVLEVNSCRKNKENFSIVINPEFLREGTAVYDFFNPPMHVISSDCGLGIKTLKKLYSFNKVKTFIVSENIAEIIKLISNVFHSVKITFANEVGNLCRKIGVNPLEVMEIFTKDSKLNISSAYLKPGFAYGGSCLPKDLKALNKLSKKYAIKMPLISSVGISNEYQKKLTYKTIVKYGENNIGVWGLSFKIGTDDLRGSPILDVVKMLIKEGYNVKLFDQSVDLKKILGANKTYIYKKIPTIEKLIEVNLDKFLKFSKVLVVNSYDAEIMRKIKKNRYSKIIDLMN